MRWLACLALGAALLTGTARGGEIILAPGDERIDGRRLVANEALWRYHRADSTDPEAGMRVTWRFEPVPDTDGREWQTVLISHFPKDQIGDLYDTTRFDAATLALSSMAVPDQSEAGEIVDVRIEVDGLDVETTVTGRTSGEVTRTAVTLEQTVFGASAPYLLALLPLEEGTTVKWPSYDPLTRAGATSSASVLGSRDFQLAGRAIRVWEVEVRDGKGLLWVAPEAPYVFRREFQLNEDARLVWEIEEFLHEGREH